MDVIIIFHIGVSNLLYNASIMQSNCSEFVFQLHLTEFSKDMCYVLKK